MNLRKISWILFALFGTLSLLTVSCEKEDLNPSDFVLPPVYVSEVGPDGPTAFGAIPAGKTVKFYLLDQASKDGMEDRENGSFSPDLQFTGTTSADGTIVSFQIPDKFDGVKLYPFLIVILDDDLSDADLLGTNHKEFFGLADGYGQIALGYINDNLLPGSFKANSEGGEVELTLIDLKVMSAIVGE